jgi:hypothetical protein
MIPAAFAASRRFRERIRNPMKSRRLSSSLMLSAILLLAATAFAAEKETVETRETVTVNGSQLPAGKYTVTWEGSGPTVQLKFLKGKNVVATVPAQLVNLKTISPGGIVTAKENDRVALTQIRPEGKKYTLNIGSESTETAAENGGR